MDGVYEDQQLERHVFIGSTFTISCSVQPQYPGGSFHILLASSNMKLRETKPAVDHSAHFLFTAADQEHQGNYTCVYHIDVYSHHFSSESRPLSLTVLGNQNPICDNNLFYYFSKTRVQFITFMV